MPRPIINAAEGETHSGSHGDYFAYEMTELSLPLGGKAIGANITRVPPGKAAFPQHHHYGEEEHFFVLSGTGILRYGSEAYPVKPQDYIVNLPGGPETAHQLVNTGAEDLVYLAISNLAVPEVVGFPDSSKTMSRIDDRWQTDSRFFVPDSAKAEGQSWDGEDGREVAKIVKG